MRDVPSKSVDLALAHLRSGGRLLVPSYTKSLLITKEVLEKFEQAGIALLKEEGNGYRLRNGKRSVYLFAGQLKMID